MARVFGDLKARRLLRERTPDAFAKQAAHFLAELNAIHPFRDGNGRTQLAFMALLAAQAGFVLEFGHLHPERFLAAMVESFQGREADLARELLALIAEESGTDDRLPGHHAR